MKNLQEADEQAQKGKSNQYGVVLHNRNQEGNLLVLQDMLVNRTYRTSKYDIFQVHEPKERLDAFLKLFPR